MKKIIALVVLVLAVAGGVFFSLNQNSGPEKQIIGTWYDSKHDSTIVFNSDKTLEVTNNKDESRDGTWKIAGKYVKLKVLVQRVLKLNYLEKMKRSKIFKDSI